MNNVGSNLNDLYSSKISVKDSLTLFPHVSSRSSLQSLHKKDNSKSSNTAVSPHLTIDTTDDCNPYHVVCE